MFLASVEESITQKMKGWYENLISHSGRLVLLRSVLQSMTFHIFRVLNPPVVGTHKLERMFASFIWGSFEDKLKHKWIQWNGLCLPYAEGGVGLKRLADIVNAYSCKLWSLFYKDEGIWANYMHKRYRFLANSSYYGTPSYSSSTWHRM